ncbi:MAG: transposase [Solirubrobacterales bacterium]|nr:transposase [Solirubrobacterales bacterium]
MSPGSTRALPTPRRSTISASSSRWASVGSALDNAPAESWVDSLKTELIADRVWRTRSQLELAVVEYIGWFNTSRLHSSLGYRNPDEVEAGWLEPGPERGLARTAPPPAVVQRLATGLSDE